jgi:hypothetical protein
LIYDVLKFVQSYIQHLKLVIKREAINDHLSTRRSL